MLISIICVFCPCRRDGAGWCNRTEEFVYSVHSRAGQNRDRTRGSRGGRGLWELSDGRWEEYHLQGAWNQQWGSKIWRRRQTRRLFLPYSGTRLLLLVDLTAARSRADEWSCDMHQVSQRVLKRRREHVNHKYEDIIQVKLEIFANGLIL